MPEILVGTGFFENLFGVAERNLKHGKYQKNLEPGDGGGRLIAEEKFSTPSFLIKLSPQMHAIFSQLNFNEKTNIYLTEYMLPILIDNNLIKGLGLS